MGKNKSECLWDEAILDFYYFSHIPQVLPFDFDNDLLLVQILFYLCLGVKINVFYNGFKQPVLNVIYYWLFIAMKSRYYLLLGNLSNENGNADGKEQ